MTTNDDEYDGYYIPKGTVVLGNGWPVRNDPSLLYILTFLFRSIVHDSKHFNDPMIYQPERYLKDGILNPDVLDTDSIAFGFGRRLVYILTYSQDVYHLIKHLLLQNLSRKTLGRQFVILNCVLSSRCL